MKKQVFALLLLLLACSMMIAGCANDNTTGETSKVDVDLTRLNTNMLTAELANIRANLNDYVGKTVRINGEYRAVYSDQFERYYFYVIAYTDPNGCCSQGIEFVWNGDHQYPDDYPEEGTKVKVVGVLQSYDEDGRVYCYLQVDEIPVVK